MCSPCFTPLSHQSLLKTRPNECYDSYLLEHGLKADGRPDPEAKDLAEGGSFETFFTETGSGKYVPRSIFVDLDPSVRSLPYLWSNGRH